MTTKVVQLSCRECQRRKRRCNKANPCGSCVQDGIECTPVQRQRLPRGRSGNQRAAVGSLQDRVRHLEAVVGQFAEILPPAAQRSDANSGAIDRKPELKERKVVVHDAVNSLKTPIAEDFWRNLVDAVDGIRDILDEDDEIDVTSSSHVQDDAVTCAVRDLVFPNASDDSMPSLLNELPDVTVRSLIEVYLDRFQPLLSILDVSQIYDLADKHNIMTALDVADHATYQAIMFGAWCTLSDAERQTHLFDSKALQQRLEKALACAGLLTTKDIRVLQAFLIYLAGLRTLQSVAHAQQWTLLALAARIAEAQGLSHHYRISSASHTVLRRLRAWYCLGMLDAQASFDRGTKPMLGAAQFPHSLTELGLIATSSLSETENIAIDLIPPDASFSTLSFYAMQVHHRIAAIAVATTSEKEIDCKESASCYQVQAAEQARILAAFEDHVKLLSRLYADPSKATSLQQFTLAVANESLLTMKLLLRCPLEKTCLELPLDNDNFDILDAGIRVLASTESKLNYGWVKWSWYSWLKWYALAVVLAELCRRSWDHQVVEAWPLAWTAYNKFASSIADSPAGGLWQPIRRLMHMVQKTHYEHISRQGVELPDKYTFDTATGDPLLTVDAEHWHDLNMPSFDFNIENLGTHLYNDDVWMTFVNELFYSDSTDRTADVFSPG